MCSINFIYTIENFDFYKDNHFENLCSYLKSLCYNTIKLKFNSIIETNIKNIKNITEKFKIKLIISVKNLKQIQILQNFIDYIEIFKITKKIPTNKNIILNTTLNQYKKLSNKEMYYNIIINNINAKKWNDLEKINFTSNVGIQFEHKNIQKIYFLNFNIRNFYITFKSIPYNLHEWSKNKLYDDCNEDLDYNFSKIYSKTKKILITGITGQDGSNLAEYLTSNVQNIIIFGTVKNYSSLHNVNIKNIILVKNL